MRTPTKRTARRANTNTIIKNINGPHSNTICNIKHQVITSSALTNNINCNMTTNITIQQRNKHTFECLCVLDACAYAVRTIESAGMWWCVHAYVLCIVCAAAPMLYRPPDARWGQTKEQSERRVADGRMERALGGGVQRAQRTMAARNGTKRIE